MPLPTNFGSRPQRPALRGLRPGVEPASWLPRAVVLGLGVVERLGTSATAGGPPSPPPWESPGTTATAPLGTFQLGSAEMGAVKAGVRVKPPAPAGRLGSCGSSQGVDLSCDSGCVGALPAPSIPDSNRPLGIGIDRRQALPVKPRRSWPTRLGTSAKSIRRPLRSPAGFLFCDPGCTRIPYSSRSSYPPATPS